MPASRFDVLGIGNAIVDVLARTEDDFLIKQKMHKGGMQLIDPTECPAGHPFRWGKHSHTPCAEHRGHPEWVCACGQELYRQGGVFVGALRCR